MSQENVEVVRWRSQLSRTATSTASSRMRIPRLSPRPGLVGGLEGTVYRGRDTQVAG